MVDRSNVIHESCVGSYGISTSTVSYHEIHRFLITKEEYTRARVRRDFLHRNQS
ncbi:hypothetical protein C8R48DRAFT_714503 [Suillus tomentosus]|nr:hypothetical protein C8R48DRAFT_714503 [Suillus tomentosus]